MYTYTYRHLYTYTNERMLCHSTDILLKIRHTRIFHYCTSLVPLSSTALCWDLPKGSLSSTPSTLYQAAPRLSLLSFPLLLPTFLSAVILSLAIPGGRAEQQWALHAYSWSQGVHGPPDSVTSLSVQSWAQEAQLITIILQYDTSLNLYKCG